jgi:hypothetical protein
MKRKMTKRQAVADFRESWNEAVRANPNLATDKPARCEAWNNYTDALCKDGLITSRQYSQWTNPF